MKKTGTMLVISVTPPGRRENGGPEDKMACGMGYGSHHSAMISVPLKTLETDTEDGQSAMPEAGDEVSLPDVMGKIVKVEGEEAYVEIVSVGGKPVESENPQNETPNEKEPAEYDKLMEMAKKHDSAMES